MTYYQHILVQGGAAWRVTVVALLCIAVFTMPAEARTTRVITKTTVVHRHVHDVVVPSVAVAPMAVAPMVVAPPAVVAPQAVLPAPAAAPMAVPMAAAGVVVTRPMTGGEYRAYRRLRRSGLAY